MFTGNSTGTWTAGGGRYTGTPATAGGFAVDLMNLAGVTQVATTSLLNLSATLQTSGRAGFVFDRYGPDDFKWVAIDVQTQQVLVGHRTPRSGWVVDAVATRTLLANTDYTLGVTLRGSTLSVALNNQAVLGAVFNAVTVDGAFGLLAVGSAASFDNVVVKTNDAAVGGGAQLLAAAQPTAFDGGLQVTSAMVAPIAAEAKRRWADSGLLDAAGLAQLDSVSVHIADFDGLVLGVQVGNTVLLDSDAAGHGWFVDATPALNEEFGLRAGDDELLAWQGSPAFNRIDMLTVIMHEFGHVIGLEHPETAGDSHDVMAATLSPSVRRLIDNEDAADAGPSSALQVSSVGASAAILNAVPTFTVRLESGQLTSSPPAPFTPLDLALLGTAFARKPRESAPVEVEAVNAVFQYTASEALGPVLAFSNEDDVTDLPFDHDEDDLELALAGLMPRGSRSHTPKN
jgi:hypothetical protein